MHLNLRSTIQFSFIFFAIFLCIHQIEGGGKPVKAGITPEKQQTQKLVKNSKKNGPDRQCVLGFHKWSHKKGKKTPAGQTGKAKSCRWDLKPYFNDADALEQPMAQVCNAMTISMALETAHAMQDRRKYDISVQAILDCFVPDKCFSLTQGCTVEDILKNIGTLEVKHRQNSANRAFGIFLHKNDYGHKFNPKNPTQMECIAEKNKEKWARNGLDYVLWEERTQSNRGTKKQKKTVFKPNIQDMMTQLRRSPLIVVTKTTKNMASYKLKSEDDLQNLDLAYDTAADQPQDVLQFKHSFFVIGYVKPANEPHIYFLVKTCLTANPTDHSYRAFGWKGKAFLKMKTAEGGRLDFNSEIYHLKIDQQ